MAGYYRGRRPYDPHAEERRAREEREYDKMIRAKKRLDRILRQFRKVPLAGDEAQAAWRAPQLRAFTLSKLADGSRVQAILRGGAGGLFLQEMHFPSWRFYRLVPRYHTPRVGEESERDRRSRR